MRTIANGIVWIVRFFRVPLRHESDDDDTSTARTVPDNNRCSDLCSPVCGDLAEQPAQGADAARATEQGACHAGSGRCRGQPTED